MRKTLLINKKVGETPLAALERGRARHHIAKDVPMTYAGRLDPMASGKLLILIGDECKKQKEYHGLDKEYIVEVLLGIGSDTGDVLGLVAQRAAVQPTSKEVKKTLQSFVGPYRTPYPLYSSKTVDGTPLFEYALKGDSVRVPMQEGVIRLIAYKGMRSMSAASLRTYVEKKIAALAPVTEESKAYGRDFRKDEALASWEKIEGVRFVVVKIKVRTSAGVYMRTLARDIAGTLGTEGLALSIRRTKIFR